MRETEAQRPPVAGRVGTNLQGCEGFKEHEGVCREHVDGEEVCREHVDGEEVCREHVDGEEVCRKYAYVSFFLTHLHG